ncbi:MAG TPA: DUF1326 domain-containing protein [Gammaproteobacteria bacterium]|nr:DUF1326 domain-containing protein [Gammaproteobacteria bacterium]
MSIPAWHVRGDWFDVCSCNIPCPCEFAQAPTDDACEGVLAYHVNEGRYGEVELDGLNVVMVSAFTGDLWGGTGKDWEVGMFLDARADPAQLAALETIWSGQAGGWMRSMARMIQRVRGKTIAAIDFELDGALAHWRVTIPGQVRAGAAALTGPTADPTRRVQTINPPGSEVGPSGKVATWGSSTEAYWNAFGFAQNYLAGRSSKHLPFEWSGPD